MNRSTKAKILPIAVLMTASVALSVAIHPFRGWDLLVQRSPDVVIARCTKTTDLYAPDKDGLIEEYKDGVVPSSIEIVSVLKGGTNATPNYLRSQFMLRQGEYYLIFANYLAGTYQAFEPYRIVPLGLEFSTNSIAGKGLDEQVRMLLERRLIALTEQIKNEEEEKQRLEEGLKH